MQEITSNEDKIVCLEVEPPVCNLTRRRVAFYERNGMFFNSYPYIQPSISAGREAIPLFLMTSHTTIDKENFIAIKNKLYKEVYKVRSNWQKSVASFFPNFAFSTFIEFYLRISWN